MKTDELRKIAAANVEPETCDPCQLAYEAGLREGGVEVEGTVVRLDDRFKSAAQRIREQMKDRQQKCEEVRQQSAALPKVIHGFLPFRACVCRQDRHLGAVEG